MRLGGVLETYGDVLHPTRIQLMHAQRKTHQLRDVAWRVVCTVVVASVVVKVFHRVIEHSMPRMADPRIIR